MRLSVFVGASARSPVVTESAATSERRKAPIRSRAFLPRQNCFRLAKDREVARKRNSLKFMAEKLVDKVFYPLVG